MPYGETAITLGFEPRGPGSTPGRAIRSCGGMGIHASSRSSCRKRRGGSNPSKDILRNGSGVTRHALILTKEKNNDDSIS